MTTPTATGATESGSDYATGLANRSYAWYQRLRFSQAREAIEAERRLYRTGAAPYDDEGTRERALAAAVTRTEQGEMSAWAQLVSTGSREEPTATP
jgi:hypothetical protein